MNIGELGNFISYAFAPASVVAPLGTVSGIGVGPIAKDANSCLVCFDCQLFLCTTPTEGTVREGKCVTTLYPATFLTGFQVEFLGIFISILGAVTVVFSANTSETRLDRDALIAAIAQKPFIIYSIVYIVGAFILTGLSASQRGRDWVFVDVGLCALFGTWCIFHTLEGVFLI